MSRIHFDTLTAVHLLKKTLCLSWKFTAVFTRSRLWTPFLNRIIQFLKNQLNLWRRPSLTISFYSYARHEIVKKLKSIELHF